MEKDWLEKNREKLEAVGVFEIVELEIDAFNLEVESKKHEELSNAALATHTGMFRLLRGIEEGDKIAAKYLFEHCMHATALLQRFYKSAPELFRNSAQYYAQMPVLAGLDPEWRTSAAKHMKSVGLGSALPEGHFKAAAYEDEFYICRRWAREAVKCLSRNRFAPHYYREICAYLLATDSFMEVMPSKMPEWLKKAACLKPFCGSEAKRWGSVARLMIRAECPDFHEHVDFISIVRGIKRRFPETDLEKNTKIGTIQNVVLDKIVEAVVTIAAEECEFH